MNDKPELGLPQSLLDILVCPACKESLMLSPEQDSLRCAQCRVAYPIRDGIPVLLADQAVPFAV